MAIGTQTWAPGFSPSHLLLGEMATQSVAANLWFLRLRGVLLPGHETFPISVSTCSWLLHLEKKKKERLTPGMTGQLTVAPWPTWPG